MDYSQFKKIPQTLIYNEKLDIEENKEIEFKAVQDTKKPIEVIQRYLKEYLNAFLNSQGGSIWFGVEDNCVVKGLFFTQKERDECRQNVDVLCNLFIPQVDSSQARLDFIPVTMNIADIDGEKFEPTNVIDGKTTTAVSKNSKKPLERLVIVASILPGSSPVYFTSKTHDQAFMRRDGGIVKMSPDVIVQRITNGRKFDQNETFDECALLGRKEIIKSCLNFLHNDKQKTRVLVLYGLISVGKSKLAEYLRQKVLSDRLLFPQTPQVYQLDMRGSLNVKHLSLNEALIQLIRSIKPSQELNLEESEPGQSETTGQVTFPLSLGPLSVFQQDLDSPSQTSGIVTSKNTQQLLNIYTNLINQNPFTLISLENVGKPQIAAKLVPQGANCCVICTCRKASGLEQLIGGPAVTFMEMNVPPLSDQEGAMIVLRELPTTDFAEAQNISKLCSGLPQVIKVLCANCRQYGIEPRQLILKLQQITPETRLRQLSPQLFSLISNLKPHQLFTLAKLSLFPSLYSDDAACAVLGQNKIERVFSELGDSFDEVTNLGLIDKVQPPILGLRVQIWWRIADAIRDFCFRNIERNAIMNVIDRYMLYFVTLLGQLKEQLDVFNGITNWQLIEQSPFKKSVPCGLVYELFLTYTPCFEILLKMCLLLMKDPRPAMRGKGVERGIAATKSMASFAKQFRPSLVQLFDEVSLIVRTSTKVDKVEMQDLDLDWMIWGQLYM